MPAYGPFGMPLHVRLDHGLVLLGAASPWVLGFSGHLGATLYTLGLAAFGLGLNAITDYPGGIWKVLPFNWHRYVEFAAPPPFILVPWVFFADAGAMPYVVSALGVAIVINAVLTRPRQNPGQALGPTSVG